MCSRCEGMGSVTDIDPTQLYDDSKSLAEGAITIPGYNADGWNVRLFSALSDSWPSANEKRRCFQRLTRSPLPDSNRRLPPYHALGSATGRNRWQRFWLVLAVFGA